MTKKIAKKEPKFIPQEKPKIKPGSKTVVKESETKVLSILPKPEEAIVEPKKETVARFNPIVENEKTEIGNKKSNEIIDSLEFIRGKDTLTLQISKKSNRSYRIQIFLNEDVEIRNSTFAGSSPAMSFWNLIKRSMKGE